ncbi:MAG: FAD-dependent oxidoreductase [Myxococcales bacterium]|nr:FAD-dependent oxidoreductase [Myxococcales bacterium]
MTAWLLDGVHDVTVFERAAHWGGHIHTVQAEVGGQALPVEMGAEFLFEEGYGGTLGVIDRFGLERWTRPMVVSLTLDQGQTTFAMPPYSVVTTLASLRPATLRRLWWLRALAARAEAIADAGDWTPTVRDLIAQTGMPTDVAEAVVIPLIASSWGIEREQAAALSAYCVVRVMGLRLKHRPHAVVVQGGLGRYIDALVADAPAVDFRLGATVEPILVRDGALCLRVDGRPHDFDEVVLACDWHNSGALCAGDGRLAAWRAAFAAVQDTHARVALHRDPRFMPRRRRHWCNANFDLTLDARPRTTIWSGRATGLPVFRTWLRPGEDPPPSTSHLAEYRHVAMVPEHLHRQARIAALQGDGGVWAAGMYTAGVDNHESALRSALRVAERLAPGAERVAWLAQQISG